MTDASTLAAEKVFGSLSREMTLSRMVLQTVAAAAATVTAVSQQESTGKQSHGQTDLTF